MTFENSMLRYNSAPLGAGIYTFPEVLVELLGATNASMNRASFVGGFSAPVLLARLCCFANDSEPSSNDAALVLALVLVPALALVPMPVLVPVLVLVLVLMPLRTLDP